MAERLSPAMLRTLRQMDERERAGWTLGRRIRWRWWRGPDQEPAAGISMPTVGALIRRKLVHHVPVTAFAEPSRDRGDTEETVRRHYAHLLPTDLYRLTIAGARVASEAGS